MNDSLDTGLDTAARGLLRETLNEDEARMKNSLALAFLGDTVWDMLVRQRLLISNEHVGALHKRASGMVNAGAQALAAAAVEPQLSEDERDVMRRGENAHAKHAAPKNQSAFDYSRATGLEALFGYLYLVGRDDRILELFDICAAIL